MKIAILYTYKLYNALCTLFCSILECLISQDVNGDTALHAAARSKAAGFARFYAKLLANNSQVLSPSRKVLQLLDLKYKEVKVFTKVHYIHSFFVMHKLLL